MALSVSRGVHRATYAYPTASPSTQIADGLSNDRLSSHGRRTPHLSKHVQKRQLQRQRTHGKLLQCTEKRNLRWLRQREPIRTRPGHRTHYPLLQQGSNLRKVRRHGSEAMPLTNKDRIDRMLCKTKSSKRNAYSIKSNLWGHSRAVPFCLKTIPLQCGCFV